MDGSPKQNDTNFSVQFNNISAADYQNGKLVVSERGEIFFEFERLKTKSSFLIVPFFFDLREDELWEGEEVELFLHDYILCLVKMDFSLVLSVAQQFNSLPEPLKKSILDIPDVPFDYFFFFLLHKSPPAALTFLSELFARTKAANPIWFENRFPVMHLNSTTPSPLNPKEIPQIINAYFTALCPKSPWFCLVAAYEILERYGEAIYCWKQMMGDEDASIILEHAEMFHPVERMPHFLVVLAQASKDQQARLPNLPILTHPSTHGVRKPKILDAEARQRRLEQLFAPNVLSKLRGQALKDVLTRPWKLQNNENLTAIEAMEYFLHLWFKNNIKQPVYIVGGRFQDGLNCKFNILSTENPLENLPRTIVFNEEEEWELSLIGELQYTDYSNAVLDMEQPDEPPFDLNYVKVEIDVCRLLQDDGDNSITIKLPKDKNFKRDKYDSNDNQSEEHESYEDGFDDSGDF